MWEVTYPIQSQSSNNSSPREPLLLLSFQVLINLDFQSKHRNQRSRLLVRGVTRELAGDEALYACLHRCVDELKFLVDASGTKSRDDSILACEGCG